MKLVQSIEIRAVIKISSLASDFELDLGLGIDWAVLTQKCALV